MAIRMKGRVLLDSKVKNNHYIEGLTHLIIGWEDRPRKRKRKATMDHLN